MCQGETDIGLELRGYRLRLGELAYRRAWRQLSEEANHIVENFEKGASSDDIIGRIAWDLYRGTGPKERAAAEKVFMAEIRNIRKAFDI